MIVDNTFLFPVVVVPFAIILFAVRSESESSSPQKRCNRFSTTRLWQGVQWAPPVASLGQAAARGAAVTFLSQGGRFVLQFGSIVVLARLLTPEAFGLVAMVTSLIGVA